MCSIFDWIFLFQSNRGISNPVQIFWPNCQCDDASFSLWNALLVRNDCLFIPNSLGAFYSAIFKTSGDLTDVYVFFFFRHFIHIIKYQFIYLRAVTLTMLTVCSTRLTKRGCPLPEIIWVMLENWYLSFFIYQNFWKMQTNSILVTII